MKAEDVSFLLPMAGLSIYALVPSPLIFSRILLLWALALFPKSPSSPPLWNHVSMLMEITQS